MQPIFGIVINGELYLNKFGKIARNCWKQIQSHFANIDLDEYVVMPNHVHGIVVIRETTVVGATHASPL
jgi:REP element-mobilizing transposase RayT